LANAISAAPTAVVTVDAVVAEDLLRISRAILRSNSLPCGAAGLAHAWAQTVSGGKQVQNQAVFPRLDGPLLIVAGSASARTHEQIAALAFRPESRIWKIHVPLNPAEPIGPLRGKEAWFATVQDERSDARVVVLCPGLQSTVQDPEWLNFHKTVSDLAVELLGRLRPAALLITGGETANHLCRLLEIQAVRLSGEVLPGIPFGTVSGGRVDQITLLTKAGGNGTVDCLDKLVYGWQDCPPTHRSPLGIGPLSPEGTYGRGNESH
jgi:uncharacterized protein YgbK (DUF1537 family)